MGITGLLPIMGPLLENFNIYTDLKSYIFVLDDILLKFYLRRQANVSNEVEEGNAAILYYNVLKNSAQSNQTSKLLLMWA